MCFKEKEDESQFLAIINTIGYYKFSQYFRHFYDISGNTKCFKEGTQGRDIIEAYQRNEELRQILIVMLLKIESRLKTQLIEVLIQERKDIYWCYHSDYSDLNLIDKATEKSGKSKSKSEYKAQSTKLFFQQYPNHTKLPAWVVLQSHEFGTLCYLMKHSKFSNQALIAIVKKFALPKSFKAYKLIDVFNALRHLRNLCVHHEKILGESIRVKPPLWKDLPTNTDSKIDNFIHWITCLLFSMMHKNTYESELLSIIEKIQATCPKSMQILHYPLP
ncbi:MAG: Abi family protein [Vampirovibrionales bacterium]